MARDPYTGKNETLEVAGSVVLLLSLVAALAILWWWAIVGLSAPVFIAAMGTAVVAAKLGSAMFDSASR